MIDEDGDYIRFSFNGFECKYHKNALEIPQSMKRVAEELIGFQKFFSNPAPGVSWDEVHDDADRDVFDFFEGMFGITNDWHQEVLENLHYKGNDIGYTFADACREAHDTLNEGGDE